MKISAKLRTVNLINIGTYHIIIFIPETLKLPYLGAGTYLKLTHPLIDANIAHCIRL